MYLSTENACHPRLWSIEYGDRFDVTVGSPALGLSFWVSVLWNSRCSLDCEQSLFCSKIRRENERDGMRDIRAASGEAASRYVRLAASHITLARRCCFEFFLSCFPTDFWAKERLLAVQMFFNFREFSCSCPTNSDFDVGSRAPITSNC